MIDPGVGFLSNFSKAGYLIHDVDGMIVTHDHIDHTFDLTAIDDLVYRMRRYEGTDRKRFCFFCAGLREQPKSKEAYVRDTSFEGECADSEREHTNACIPGISIMPFKTRHCDKGVSTFGFACTMEDSRGRIRVGVTSDTGYFDGLADAVAGCEVIVANISNPDKEDYDNPAYLKERHLGLNGTRRLIRETNAQVYVITEFWAGKGDRRVPLCQKVVYDLKRLDRVTGRCVIPADIGMTIRLGFDDKGNTALKMACTSCGNRMNPTLVDCGKITVVRPDRPYGPIRYLCPECMRWLTIAPG